MSSLGVICSTKVDTLKLMGRFVPTSNLFQLVLTFPSCFSPPAFFLFVGSQKAFRQQFSLGGCPERSCFEPRASGSSEGPADHRVLQDEERRRVRIVLVRNLLNHRWVQRCSGQWHQWESTLAAAEVAQSVKRLGLRSLKRGATKLMWVRFSVAA